MIVNISGLSGSGKTTLIAYLLANYPSVYGKLISYTNRIKRLNEIDGLDYNFVDQDFVFLDKNFILKRNRSDGTYAVNKSDLDIDEDKVLLTTFPPKGVLILRNLGYSVIPFILLVNREERRRRMLERGDNIADMEKRLIEDDREYSLEENRLILRNNIFSVLDGSHQINDIALLIHNFLFLKNFRD